MPNLQLSPKQFAAYKWFNQCWERSNIFRLWCSRGHGRTTLLKKLQSQYGGAFLSISDFVNNNSKHDPLALEDSLYAVVMNAMRNHDTVFIDDWHIATASVSDNCHFYPRNGYAASR